MTNSAENTQAFQSKIGNKGVLVAFIVILTWLSCLLFSIYSFPHFSIYRTIAMMLLMTHLYTGLFITAHDGMHHSISDNVRLNDFISGICTMLYAVFSFKTLKEEHTMHHNNVSSKEDPDFYTGGFFKWYYQFFIHYFSVKQFIIMALIFNGAHYIFGVSQPAMILFWIVPSLLSTFQLFYFGTYAPHKNPEEIQNEHKTRTQSKNHFIGFITCYFFGYHLEHHSKPYVPWWLLWKEK